MKRCILVILMGMMFMAGCDILNSIKGLAPGVTFKEMPLVESPSISNLAAYYCPDVLGSTACSIALPSPPDKDSLKFVFEPRFGVANKNNFPIPTTEVLVAIQLFKGRSLGNNKAIFNHYPLFAIAYKLFKCFYATKVFS